LTIPRGHMKDLKFNFILNNTKLRAPFTKNQVVGTINLQLNNKIIEQQPLIVLTEVVKGGFFATIKDYIKMFFYC
ncbi:MAG: serine-type D-Ala-D-Ala carboxypeptidase, partial [Arsenophonus sp. ET-DL12-MAG3]